MQFRDQPHVQSHHYDGGSAGGSGSDSSGSIVTGCIQSAGSMGMPGGTEGQRALRDSILHGECSIDTSLVGGRARDFITQVGGWVY